MRQFGVTIAMSLIAVVSGAHAQESEAGAGFSLGGTFSGLAAASTDYEKAPRSGSLVDGGVRLMLYPTWKLSRHWTVAGAYQVASRPYYYSGFSSQGYGLRGSIVQGYLSYSQVWRDASIVVRAGELSSAFGSFSLRYDDRDNPLVDLPMQYGYYGSLVTLNALAGIQVDAAWKRWDTRAQFVNSSPANPRSITASEQYGSWAGGGGYTILQGLRVGASGYRGPYLDRHYAYYLPGEGRPRDMAASGVGLEAQWARGHWSLHGELQRFVMGYRAIPTFHEHTGYVDAQRVLSPRWYVAARFGYLSADHVGRRQSIETVAAYRPAASETIKLSYETTHASSVTRPDRTLAIQFVTVIRPVGFASH